jgi:hypothetical protein
MINGTHVFIKETFSAAEKAPPPFCAGGWVVLALFQPQAVALVMVMKQ